MLWCPLFEKILGVGGAWIHSLKWICILSVTEASRYIRKKVMCMCSSYIFFCACVQSLGPLVRTTQHLGVPESWALSTTFCASLVLQRTDLLPLFFQSYVVGFPTPGQFGVLAATSFSSLSVFTPAVPFDGLPPLPFSLPDSSVRSVSSKTLACIICQMDMLLDLLPIPVAQWLRVSFQSWFHYLLAVWPWASGSTFLRPFCPL